MNRWALVVEQSIGVGQNMRWDAEVIVETDGSREEALQLLWHHVQGFSPRHPKYVQRRRIYRDGDGFLVINTGTSMSDFPCRFRLMELVSDTGPI
ncbi:hypothetical protein [Streptomyces sp. B6B3]|uniref:hypothetical protein n=1 Tax=Streptomyces sp. B6B3 TaxID=3153570 RepID=UPI00325C3C98